MDLRVRAAGRPRIADLLHALTRLYRLDAAAPHIAAAFGAARGEDPWAGGYVAPLAFAPIVTAGRDFVSGPRPAGHARTPRLVPRLWGVLPPPSAGDPARRIAALANPDSPFWIGNLRNAEFRCLVPATRVMLWGSGTDYEGRRLRHWFALPGAPLFAMAAVWKDEEVPAFALLSRPAEGEPRGAGCRTMPLALQPGSPGAQAWLHGGWDRARAVLDAPSAPVVEVDTP